MAKPERARAEEDEAVDGGLWSDGGRMRVRRAPMEPGERGVEEEAGFAGVPGGGEGPVGVEEPWRSWAAAS